MGYEKDIISELSKKYEVTFIDHNVFELGFRGYFGKNIFHKIFRKMTRVLGILNYYNFEKFDNNNVKNIIFHNQNAFDYVFVIRGDYFPSSYYKELKIRNSNAIFILYEWDDVRKLVRHNFFSYFDKLYSYNVLDCKKYEMSYSPMFVNKNIIKKEKKYDICFVASANSIKRIEFIKKVYELYSQKYKFFIYIYQKDGDCNFYNYSTPLNKEQYNNIVAESKVVLEFPVSHQRGPTTRCLDAYYLGTKVITTNKFVKFYPFYNDNNYLILQHKYNIPEDFIEKPFIQKEGMPKTFNVNDFLKRLGL